MCLLLRRASSPVMERIERTFAHGRPPLYGCRCRVIITPFSSLQGKAHWQMDERRPQVAGWTHSGLGESNRPGRLCTYDPAAVDVQSRAGFPSSPVAMAFGFEDVCLR